MCVAFSFGRALRLRPTLGTSRPVSRPWFCINIINIRASHMTQPMQHARAPSTTHTSLHYRRHSGAGLSARHTTRHRPDARAPAVSARPFTRNRVRAHARHTVASKRNQCHPRACRPSKTAHLRPLAVTRAGARGSAVAEPRGDRIDTLPSYYPVAEPS